MVAAGQNTILHALRKQNFTAWEEGKPAPTKAKQFISSNSPLQRAIWLVTVISLVREIGNNPNTHCHYTATNYSAPRWRYRTHTSVSCLITWVAVWWKKSSEKLNPICGLAKTGWGVSAWLPPLAIPLQWPAELTLYETKKRLVQIGSLRQPHSVPALPLQITRSSSVKANGKQYL